MLQRLLAEKRVSLSITLTADIEQAFRHIDDHLMSPHKLHPQKTVKIQFRGVAPEATTAWSSRALPSRSVKAIFVTRQSRFDASGSMSRHPEKRRPGGKRSENSREWLAAVSTIKCKGIPPAEAVTRNPDAVGSMGYDDHFFMSDGKSANILTDRFKIHQHSAFSKSPNPITSFIGTSPPMLNPHGLKLTASTLSKGILEISNRLIFHEETLFSPLKHPSTGEGLVRSPAGQD